MHTPDPHNTCLAFIRSIADLKNYVPHPQTIKYVEISYSEKEEKWQADPHCEKALRYLVDHQMRQWMPASNVFDFDVLWRFNNGIDEKLHKSYLNELCETFYESMCELIDRVGHSQADNELPQMVDEAYQHWNTCKQKCMDFCRPIREGLLQSVQSYILSKDTVPLVLYGKPGCGKSALIAQAAADVSLNSSSSVMIIYVP